MNAGARLLLALSAVAAGCGDASVDQPAPAAPGGTPLWAQRFGKSTGADRVAVAVDAAGNVVVGGRFFATADFGGGPVTSPANNWQAFVAKYDPAGALLWMRSLGDVYEERVTYVDVDGAGDVYIVGDFRGTLDLGGGPLQSEGSGPDLFVAKLGPGGDHVWSKRFGVSGYDAFQAMAVEPDGSIALMGTASDGTDFGTGPIAFAGSPFIARLDASGEAAFVTSFANDETSSAYPTALAHAPGGAIVVASMSYTNDGGTRTLLTTLDPSGKVAWERAFPTDGGGVSAIDVAADGEIFICGQLGSYLTLGDGVSASGNSNGGDAYVAAFGNDGAGRWIQTFRSQEIFSEDTGGIVYGTVWPAALAATTSGVVVTGGYRGSVDLGGGVRESVAADKPNEYGYVPALEDVFAVRLDGAGAYLWDASFGDSEAQVGTAAAVDPSGDVLVAGSAKGTLPFARGKLDDTPYYQGFVVKLAR